LRIALNVTHVDAAAECGWLATGGGKQRRGRHGRHAAQQQQQWRQAETLALTDAVVQRLAALDAAAFSASCPAAAARLSPPATPAVLQLQARRRPLHVGGRYLKLRRGIPQSPWLIDGARKGEGSVQEAIEAAVLPAFQADSYTLVTAGRALAIRSLNCHARRPWARDMHVSLLRPAPAAAPHPACFVPACCCLAALLSHPLSRPFFPSR
jgi:tRNA pseudouridine synthase 10